MRCFVLFCALSASLADPLCNDGLEQSPIDINTTETVLAGRHQLHPLSVSGALTGTPKMDVNKDLSLVLSSATTFHTGSFKGEVLNVHFHWAQNGTAGSEHTFNGEHSVLEMHMVTQGDDESYRVVGTLFEIGDANPEIAKILAGGEVTISGSFFVGSLDSYYNYPGSLTTDPPCTEGLTWYVREQIQTISQEQLDGFRALGLNKTTNARATQPLNGRTVVYYNDYDIELAFHKTLPLWDDYERKLEDDGSDEEYVTISLVVLFIYSIVGAIVIYCLAKKHKAKLERRQEIEMS